VQNLWIDAIEFENYGGWMRETQFVREMGQPYLIANHTPGVPVENASTHFTVEKSGYYRFHVRTKNWKFPEAPGKFTLKVDDIQLKNVCGKMPTHRWYWEIADDIYLEAGEHCLEACDKTGWLSRFASVIITDDMDFTPSPELPIMLKQRAEFKKIDTTVADKGEWDYIVVGAGPGGIGAAISAARHGLKTALISGRPCLGGNASSEGTIGFDGATFNHPGYHETGISAETKRIHEELNYTWQQAIEVLVNAEPLITVFDNELCISAECEGNIITSIECVNTLTLQKSRFKSRLFADCTGDGWLGYYAGAKYRVGREAKHEFGEKFALDAPDTLTMSGCITGTRQDVGRLLSFYLEDVGHPVDFKASDWAVKMPEGDKLNRKPQSKVMTEWWMENSNDYDDIFDAEFVRDELVRMVVGYFDWLKNSYTGRSEYQNRHMKYLALNNSKRENRRLVGDYMMNQNDFVEDKYFEDTVSYCGWKIDLHHPRGIYSEHEGPFYADFEIPITPIPYRCLYSCNVNNLFMAGRCVSVSHIALGSTRVESTINTLGQAIGVAAYLCNKYQVLPRDIYNNHIKELQQLLIKDDQTIFGVLNEDPDDLARTATVTATSEDKEIGGFASNVINGKLRSTPDECNTWISDIKDGLPQSITLTLEKASEISEIHITAVIDLELPRGACRSFPHFDYTARHITVECFDGNDWLQVFEIKDNYKRKIIAKIDPVLCEKLRVNVHSTSGADVVKINEIRIY